MLARVDAQKTAQLIALHLSSKIQRGTTMTCETFICDTERFKGFAELLVVVVVGDGVGILSGGFVRPLHIAMHWDN